MVWPCYPVKIIVLESPRISSIEAGIAIAYIPLRTKLKALKPADPPPSFQGFTAQTPRIISQVSFLKKAKNPEINWVWGFFELFLSLDTSENLINDYKNCYQSKENL